MDDSPIQAAPAVSPVRHGLFHPSTLIVLIANLFPLIGILLWGWDAFLLLMLYWMETGVIAFWTVVRIALSPAAAAGNIKFDGTTRPAKPLAIAAFFTFHAGVFMAVHLLFLWALFSGDWPRRIGGIGDFVTQVVWMSGLWVPLLILFIGRGLRLLIELLPPKLATMFGLKNLQAARSAPNAIEGLLIGLYGRIVLMQFAIIFGAMFAILIGSIVPFILLIAFKTMADLLFPDAFYRLRTRAKAQSRQ